VSGLHKNLLLVMYRTRLTRRACACGACAQEVDFCRYWDALDTGGGVKWAVRWESKAASDVLVASAATILTAGAELAENPWRQVRCHPGCHPSPALLSEWMSFG